MDILTHAISGTAVAACAATFVRTKPLSKIKILGIGTLGGMWPDIDAISMWSKFDSVFGQLFNLPSTGRVIYGSKFWYSHHAFFHSLIASLLFGLIIFLLLYFVPQVSEQINRARKVLVCYLCNCKHNQFHPNLFYAHENKNRKKVRESHLQTNIRFDSSIHSQEIYLRP